MAEESRNIIFAIIYLLLFVDDLLARLIETLSIYFTPYIVLILKTFILLFASTNEKLFINLLYFSS